MLFCGGVGAGVGVGVGVVDYDMLLLYPLPLSPSPSPFLGSSPRFSAFPLPSSFTLTLSYLVGVLN